VEEQADAAQDQQARRQVMENLIDALRLFTVETDVFVDVFARAHALGRNDLNAIMWISQASGAGDPLTAGELATRLGLGPPATTALIDRLEQAGHVRRERDGEDRRKVTLAMQEPALALAVAFFQPLGARMDGAVADLGTDQLAITAEVVRRLTAAVTTTRMNQTG